MKKHFYWNNTHHSHEYWKSEAVMRWWIPHPLKLGTPSPLINTSHSPLRYNHTTPYMRYTRAFQKLNAHTRCSEHWQTLFGLRDWIGLNRNFPVVVAVGLFFHLVRLCRVWLQLCLGVRFGFLDWSFHVEFAKIPLSPLDESEKKVRKMDWLDFSLKHRGKSNQGWLMRNPCVCVWYMFVLYGIPSKMIGREMSNDTNQSSPFSLTIRHHKHAWDDRDKENCMMSLFPPHRPSFPQIKLSHRSQKPLSGLWR